MSPEPFESFGFPRFNRGQRVYVIRNRYRNHGRLDHLLGEKVIITGRSWERGAYWYSIKTPRGEKIHALRFGDFVRVS